MKYCPDCSFTLREQTTFCPECGVRLQPSPPVVDASGGPVSTTGLSGIGWQPPTPAPHPSKRSSRAVNARTSGSGQQAQQMFMNDTRKTLLTVKVELNRLLKEAQQ